MRTPAGFECPYFFGDYYRGRQHEECRLIGNTPPPHNWQPKLCQTCPIPGIIQANACQNMILTGHVDNGFLGFHRRMKIEAYCQKSKTTVSEPHVGCGLCHPLPSMFLEK